MAYDVQPVGKGRLVPISDGLISARQLCSNAVDTRHIAPDAVTPTEVLTGFNFVELVTVLPVTGNFEGRMVYLTTDDKLYRHDGSAFLLAVDGADITAATISGDRMIANTITAGEIAAATITASEIAANTITGANLIINTITAREIAGVTITASEIAANTITGDKMIVNTITAREIAGVTITASEIAANTITADKLNVTTLSAITASMGVLTVDNTITMGTGGVFRTATSGNRIELTASEDDRINLYTGDSFENNPGKIIGAVTGAGAARTLDTQIVGPSTTGDIGSVSIVIRSESNDDSTSPPGVLFSDTSGSTQTPEFKIRNGMLLLVDDGSASAPIISFNSDTDTGMYRAAANTIGIVAGGTEGILVGTGYLATIGNGPREMAIKHDAAGAAANPTYSFTGDLDTGMYSPAANELALGVGNSQRVHITGSFFAVAVETTGDAANAVHQSSNNRLQRSTASSLRYKRNVTDAPIDLTRFSELQARVFQYKRTHFDSDAFYWGMVAEEVEAVYPKMVDYQDGQAENVRYANLVVVAIEKIKELEIRLAVLEAA